MVSNFGDLDNKNIQLNKILTVSWWQGPWLKQLRGSDRNVALILVLLTMMFPSQCKSWCIYYVTKLHVKCIIRDFKIRDYPRLDARSPMSGGLDRVRSVVACCGAKTQIKLLHYQLRTTRNCSSRIHFEDVFPKSQRWAYLLFCWWNSRWGRVCFALRCLQVDKFYLSILGVRRICAWLAEFRWVSCQF